MENKEERMLARLCANYLVLGQFETFRATILNLVGRNADLAMSILKAVIEKGGRINNILWSESVPSLAHLRWMCLVELHELEKKLLNGRPRSLENILKLGLIRNLGLVQELVECLLLLEILGHELQQEIPTDHYAKEDNSIENIENSSLNKETPKDIEYADMSSVGFEIADIFFGRLQRLLSISTGEEGVTTKLMQDFAQTALPDGLIGPIVKITTEVRLERLQAWTRMVATKHPQFLDSLCKSISRQRELESCVNSQWKQPWVQSATIDIGPFDTGQVEKTCESSVNPDFTKENFPTTLLLCPPGQQKGNAAASALPLCLPDDQQKNNVEAKHDIGCHIQKEAQWVYLKAIKVSMSEEDLEAVLMYMEYLQKDAGIPEDEYIDVMRLIATQCVGKGNKEAAWMFMVYEKLLASGQLQLLTFLEGAQNEIAFREAEEFRVTSGFLQPPLQRLHARLKAVQSDVFASDSYATEVPVVSAFMHDMFNYARINGIHVLETVVNAALSAIETLDLQLANNVLMPFPPLRALVAAMGWDLLAGKTADRCRLLDLIWLNRSKEGGTLQGLSKRGDEGSCVEHLCSELCFFLELASFAADVNSGREWDVKSSRVFSAAKNRGEWAPVLPFVANLVLERLSMHSPLRVLFDVVPSVKSKNAFELMNMLPVNTELSFFKRQRDIELLHMHFGFQAAVKALAIIELQASDGEHQNNRALSFLEILKFHLNAILTPARRVWLLGMVVNLLHMDESFLQATLDMGALGANLGGIHANFEGEQVSAVVFIGHVLDVLHKCLPSTGFDVETKESKDIFARTYFPRLELGGLLAKEAWEGKAGFVRQFVEEWRWRLAVLQRLTLSSQRQWPWKEALAILRAAPSTLLNMCVQRAQYDLGKEAVSRFALPAEDAASLQLAEWVDTAVAKASMVQVENAVSRVAEGETAMDVASVLKAPLSPLSSGLLCLDVAASSARTNEMSRQLVEQARVLLTQVAQTSSQRSYPMQLEQHLEACLVLVSKRVLQRLSDILDQDQGQTLQAVLSGNSLVLCGPDNIRQSPRQRALTMLHQAIEDAYSSKGQFLSGKLHNLVKALADDDIEEGPGRPSYGQPDKRHITTYEHGLLVGLGFRTPLKETNARNSQMSDTGGDVLPFSLKPAMKRFLGPLTGKPMAYLSAFILYIAMIGDIVDGADTTHDFNYFSLIYQRPNDLLSRLVFERGSADAAGKLAEIMGADLVHQVISACVPPIFPPRAASGWASMSHDLFPHLRPGIIIMDNKEILYHLDMDVIKHLTTLSPVRAILACVFGNGRYHPGETGGIQQSSSWIEMDEKFYIFAMEQAERFPTLQRWIQMQANLKRFYKSALTSKKSDRRGDDIIAGRTFSMKRPREAEVEIESEDEDGASIFINELNTEISSYKAKQTSSNFVDTVGAPLTIPCSILLDWEDEQLYQDHLLRLMDDGKLVDALAFADRCLRDGAPDKLLQLLIERGEDSNGQSNQLQGGVHQDFWDSTWQYCVRLRDKRLAATLALRYFHRWELDAAIDVMTMCSCHLEHDSLHKEVLQVKQNLQQYSQILRADGQFRSWQEVETSCQNDPEGLAMRLASKGAVTVALDVVESFNLSDQLRRELQGRHLVKLLTSDPISGGGPAEGLRFLGSLQHPEDALPVAMGAMEQLPNLQSKQLLVHFLLKRHTQILSPEELERMDKLALGLKMLGALPLPWQQRCSGLHEHPHLILETLIMWKQLQAAAKLLQDFPSLRNDRLIIAYASKAISIGERQTATAIQTSKSSPSVGLPSKHSFNGNIAPNFNKDPQKFSWARDTKSKIMPKDGSRKRKSTQLPPSQKAAWDAMAGVGQDGYDRLAPIAMADEWVLSGDPVKDDAVRALHRYESAPSFVLFKAIISLCAEPAIAVKATVELCVSQISVILSSQCLFPSASSEAIERAFHATETFVQVLLHARTGLKKLLGNKEAPMVPTERSSDEFGTAAQPPFIEKLEREEQLDLPKLLKVSEIWLDRIELLQSLLGSGVITSLEDVADENSAVNLRDRLILEERYPMALYTCTKCKIDAFPVWDSWGHALLRIEHYAQARLKFKQAFNLYKEDAAPVVRRIVHTMVADPPTDVSAARSLYIHMAKSVSTASDDSLSADSYLNVLYIPTFTKAERSYDYAGNYAMISGQFNHAEDFATPLSNLDNIRYEECIYYLQEYARQDLLMFMFEHGHYKDACLLFFPSSAVRVQLPAHQASANQKPDPLATDYGSIEDLCDLSVAYGAIPILEHVIGDRIATFGPEDSPVLEHTAAALGRICNYCETHRHFNHLYRFQVLRKDYIAAGLCCIQLFLNSPNQEQALPHLEHAKAHFEEGLLARQLPIEGIKASNRTSRTKTPSEKFTEEDIVKFSARINLQMKVTRTFGNAEGPPWKYSLFGNPSDADTLKRRCEIAEALIERDFHLAFQAIHDLGLSAVNIYAGAAAALAEKRNQTQLLDLVKNIKGTLDSDDFDQVLSAAIYVYASKHHERPSSLIEKLNSNHRKVLAFVMCGRWKSAFQAASRDNNIVDVQWVARQARLAGALSVEDLCKQWLAQAL